MNPAFHFVMRYPGKLDRFSYFSLLASYLAVRSAGLSEQAGFLTQNNKLAGHGTGLGLIVETLPADFSAGKVMKAKDRNSVFNYHYPDL